MNYPIQIGRVALTVNDPVKVARFYETVVGLERQSGDGETIRLGAGNATLLELRVDKNARRRSPREAGLFHTAFLLPDRKSLGRWLHHAVDKQFPVAGASDHAVSEAMYLTDPEGNGVEIYSDRPRNKWMRNGQIYMTTEHLDLHSLSAAADGPWTGAPEGTIVGHVHLQVGQLAPAEDFWGNTVGLDKVTDYPGASFWSTGGYHHHIATNVWNSRGAAPRDLPSTGLADLELVADAANFDRLKLTTDPWNTPITVTKGA